MLEKIKEKELAWENCKIKYTLKKSQRAKNLRLSVNRAGKVSLVMPCCVSELLAENFIQKKFDWILKKINYFQNENSLFFLNNSPGDYLEHKNLALEVAQRKAQYYGSFYNFKYKKINIRDQKTRWGSCSINGNLSFNYRLIFLPEKISDYIVIHELCHLREFNHSEKFWKLVEDIIPDYKETKNKLGTFALK